MAQAKGRVQDPYEDLPAEDRARIERDAKPKVPRISDAKRELLKEAYANRVAAIGWEEVGQSSFAKEFYAQEAALLKQAESLG